MLLLVTLCMKPVDVYVHAYPRMWLPADVRSQLVISSPERDTPLRRMITGSMAGSYFLANNLITRPPHFRRFCTPFYVSVRGHTRENGTTDTTSTPRSTLCLVRNKFNIQRALPPPSSPPTFLQGLRSVPPRNNPVSRRYFHGLGNTQVPIP
jgi:hypothetical protein